MKPFVGLQQALQAIQQKDCPAAIHLLTQLLRQLQPAPAGVTAYTSLADWLQAITTNPDQPAVAARDAFLEASLLLAYCYKETAELPQAIALLERLDSLYPDTPVLMHQLGRFYFLAGQPWQALTCLTQLLHLRPQASELYADLACLAQVAGADEEALELVALGMATGPEAPLLEALLFCCQGNPDRLRASFTDLCLHMLSPQTFESVRRLAWHLYQQGHFPLARKLALGLLAQLPEDSLATDCSNLLLLSCLQAGQPLEAIRYLLPQLQPKGEAGNWYKLGICFAQIQMPMAARHAFNHCLLQQGLASLHDLARGQLGKLPQQVELGAAYKEILQLAMLDPAFRQELRQEPVGALEAYGIACTPELAELLQRIDFSLLETGQGC